MKLFTGLASTAASLSGDMLRSISRPSRDPAAGVIEQTSGCTHCPPFSLCHSNETDKASEGEMLKVCLRVSEGVRALDKVRNGNRGKLEQAEMDRNGNGKKDIRRERVFADRNESLT